MIAGRQIALYLAVVDAAMSVLIYAHVLPIDQYMQGAVLALANTILLLIAAGNTTSTGRLSLDPRRIALSKSGRKARHAATVAHIAATTPSALIERA